MFWYYLKAEKSMLEEGNILAGVDKSRIKLMVMKS